MHILRRCVATNSLCLIVYCPAEHVVRSCFRHSPRAVHIGLASKCTVVLSFCVPDRGRLRAGHRSSSSRELNVVNARSSKGVTAATVNGDPGASCRDHRLHPEPQGSAQVSVRRVAKCIESARAPARSRSCAVRRTSVDAPNDPRRGRSINFTRDLTVISIQLHPREDLGERPLITPRPTSIGLAAVVQRTRTRLRRVLYPRMPSTLETHRLNGKNDLHWQVYPSLLLVRWFPSMLKSDLLCSPSDSDARGRETAPALFADKSFFFQIVGTSRRRMRLVCPSEAHEVLRLRGPQ